MGMEAMEAEAMEAEAMEAEAMMESPELKSESDGHFYKKDITW